MSLNPFAPKAAINAMIVERFTLVRVYKIFIERTWRAFILQV